MLDIAFIRENPDIVAEKSRQKGYQVDITQLLGFDSERRELLSKVDELRAKRNSLQEQAKGQKPDPDAVEAGRQLKHQLTDLEHQLAIIELEYAKLLKGVPNMPVGDVPIGTSEADNVIAKTVGTMKKFDFKPKLHHQLAEPYDLIDTTRAVKIAGSRFAYLKGDLVRLQFAIIALVMQTLGDEPTIARLIAENNLDLASTPFTPVLPPAMLKTEPYVASARLNAEEVTYKIEQDDLWLNASAEHTLCTMYWNETLPEAALPIRYIGYSTSFRREAGTYGKDTDGIFRMHQFDKLEMEVFSTAETGLQEHLLLIAVQEELLQQLGIPYRVIQKCSVDIGKPNARGIDIDSWFPGQNNYRETHTADYMTDYQARDLKIRVRRQSGLSEFVHTNDATGFALGRIMAAIMENNQTSDGMITVPDVLIPLMGGKTTLGTQLTGVQ